MTTPLAYNKAYAFNAICPYYTMFPLEYPFRIIKKHRAKTSVVLDPFCGRGTTIYAARKLGLRAYGLDSSPIAATIARAKLAQASLDKVIALAKTLVATPPTHVPNTLFFRRAYAESTLQQLCSLREGLLLEKRSSNASSILRAAVLGCLHGPRTKSDDLPSYFSNQMPRTFASKPDYSVRFWKKNNLSAPNVDVIKVLKKKLSRISDLESETPTSIWGVRCADSRCASSFDNVPKADLIVTSPPYYGMRTYVEDQWLRMWFLGGNDDVEYGNDGQLCHSGHDAFVNDLAMVWKNVRSHSRADADLYVRFGTIPSMQVDAKALLKRSLQKAGGWEVRSVRSALSASAGKRQANLMGSNSEASVEFDLHATAA